jgi:hypothetical protein
VVCQRVALLLSRSDLAPPTVSSSS